MTSKRIFLAALLAFGVAPALAQAPPGININGTIEKFDGQTLSVKPDGGAAAETLKVAPDLVVLQNKKATLADIRPNDYVASAAVRKEDGKLHSTELRVFPESMRGLGEGQRPMNDPRNQVMTNATVTGAAVTDGSNHIKVKFANGGESELILDPGVPVTRIDPADKALIKPGVKVRVQGAPGPDGPTAKRVTLL